MNKKSKSGLNESDLEVELEYYDDCMYDGMPIVYPEEVGITLSAEDVRNSLTCLGGDSTEEEEPERSDYKVQYTKKEAVNKSPAKAETVRVISDQPKTTARIQPPSPLQSNTRPGPISSTAICDQAFEINPMIYKSPSDGYPMDMSRCTMVYLVPAAHYYTPCYQPTYVETEIRKAETVQPVVREPSEKDIKYLKTRVRDAETRLESGQAATRRRSFSPNSPSKAEIPQQAEPWSRSTSPTASDILEMVKLEEEQLLEEESCNNGTTSSATSNGHRKRKLRCPVCGKISTTPGNLKRHARIHTGEKPYKCVECGQDFTRLTDLKRHALVHGGMKVYRCPKCGKGFSLKGNLIYHQNNFCMIKTEFQCEKCEEQFFSKERLDAHKTSQCIEKVNECKICGKRFSQAGNLKRHIRTHTGEKPYVCKHCDKGFAGTSDLKRHILIHTGEKPYKCAICSKGFRIKCNLTIHERIHTGEKPYKCKDCNLSFRTSSNMYTHIRKHQHDTEKHAGTHKSSEKMFSKVEQLNVRKDGARFPQKGKKGSATMLQFASSKPIPFRNGESLRSILPKLD